MLVVLSSGISKMNLRVDLMFIPIIFEPSGGGINNQESEHHEYIFRALDIKQLTICFAITINS